jgi:hypothetical protein
VTHVLAVTALELGHPITVFVGVKTDDRLLGHAALSCIPAK